MGNRGTELMGYKGTVLMRPWGGLGHTDCGGYCRGQRQRDHGDGDAEEIVGDDDAESMEGGA